MKDKFTVDFDHLTQSLLPQKRAYRLADVENRIERVAYDLVRFRDNADTDQLWKIEESADGPIIVALYGEDGAIKTSESSTKQDWDAIPDKKAVHIFYKGEALMSLSSEELGIPTEEFGIVRRWLPRKLGTDQGLQKALFSKVASSGRELIAQRFPELRKVVG
jgi:formate-dependent phosphoribosylglycinamide formyltransferase (GAR transformylase)